MELTTGKYKEGIGKKESFLISSLAREDKNIFTIEDVRAIIGAAAKKVVYNLKKKKWILPLKRGLYVIVPLDIGVRGADSFVMHNFVIGSKLVEPYYISYWSALNYYGFSDQIPSATFVATTMAMKNVEILDSNYIFIQLSKKKFFGAVEIELDNEKINISDKNKTIADCLDHPEYCGGIDEIARSLYFSINEIDLEEVKQIALKMGNLTILKRLGYILDASGILKDYEDIFDSVELSKGYSLLDPLLPVSGSHNQRWGLLINTKIKPEGWMY